MLNNETKIVIPFLGVIFLVSVAIAAISHFAKVNFGVLGVIAWIIVIAGAIYFVIYVLGKIFGWF